MQFNKEDWVYLGQWVQPTLSEATWHNWSNNSSYPFSIPHIEGGFLSFYGHSFVLKKDMDVLRKFVDDHKGDYRILQIIEEWVHNVFSESKDFCSCGTPLETLQRLSNFYPKIVNPWIFLLIIGDILDEEIKDICQKEGYDFLTISKAVTPLYPSFMVRQVNEAKKLHDVIAAKKMPKEIAAIKEQDPKLALKIEQHVERFAFSGVHHFVGEPYTLEKFFIHTPRASSLKEKQAFPENLSWHIRFVSLCAWARTHMAETSDILQHKVLPIIKNAAEQIGLPREDYMWLSFDEYIVALQNKSTSLPPIADRKNLSGMYSLKQVIISGATVQEYIDAFVPKHIAAFPLKGLVACKGTYTGIARIVVAPQDIDKVEEGDILVAQETTPDFIMGMKKAGAIITARGGITSHAAIVSRELDVPCVVGVKGATDTIQDGQRIIVDNGEVRVA